MRRLHFVLINCTLIAALTLTAAAPALAQGGEDAFIAGLLQRMSPEARIGQLFIVAFDGSDTAASSDIADLILNYHIGGVILSADHGNIIDNGDRTPIDVARLTSSLQLLALTTNPDAQTATPPIPLLIALEQDGGGPAYSAITSGLTPQPNPMAIGATWNPADAQAVGQVVGAEMSVIGVNLLLGPSLDVLTSPDPNGGDEGVRSFGGDPYWVGALAGAYVRGLREGAGGHIAVALKHFPGQGGLRHDADAIDASLDQLKRVDLTPYYRLMKVAAGETRPLADAVLSTHARYRGFDSLRGRTNPFSVDAAALGALLQVQEMVDWRNAGGVIVSGSLGDDTLRRYYDPTGTTFPSRQIALDAFLAGNDALVLNDFSLNPTASSEAQTIRDTIRFFRQKYGEDPAFQERVDRTVTRILRLKYRLYPEFVTTDIVVVPARVDERMRQGLPAAERVAQDALTRLYPSRAQVAAAPLPVPSPTDTFLVFADDRSVVDCSRCPVRPTLSTEVISRTLAQIGGIPGEQIVSLGFADLKAFLAGSPAARDLREDFARAAWIVLVQQNVEGDVQQSDAARGLLRERTELIAGKRVVLITLGPPYEVSAEDLRFLTAYYAAYSPTPPFFDATLRAIFGLFEPASAAPVSVDAIGYDLKTQTEPDPNQFIVPYLYIGETPLEGTPTPAPPSLRVGDMTNIRTEVIRDRNGNPVPDGTPVRFTIVYRDVTGGTTEKIDAMTENGAATIDVPIQSLGRLEIQAISEPALNSVVLQLVIREGAPVTVQTIEPPPPTPTLAPTSTPTLAPTPTITPTPVSFIDNVFGRGEPRRVNVIDFVLSLFGVVCVGVAGYRIESRRGGGGAVDRAVRLVLWGSLCGLIAYSWYGLGLPGADAVRGALGDWGALIVTLIGTLTPYVVARQRMGNRSANG